MDWKAYLWVGLGVVLLCVSIWLVSASVTRTKVLSEIAQAPRDTTYNVDTLWLERVKIKTIQKIVLDTVYFPLFDSSQYVEPETTYVAMCDTTTDRYRLHVEFGSPIPLSPLSAFQNITVDIKDSVKTVEIVVHHVETVTEWPIAWFVASAAVFSALGFYIGNR